MFKYDFSIADVVTIPVRSMTKTMKSALPPLKKQSALALGIDPNGDVSVIMNRIYTNKKNDAVDGGNGNQQVYI